MTETPDAPQAERTRSRRADKAPVLVGPARATANVCQAVNCLSALSNEVLAELGQQVITNGFTDIAVQRVGCLGMCSAGPLVEIPETGQIFQNVEPGAIGEIVEALAAAKVGGEKVPELKFFHKQLRIATENCGRIDPESVKSYTASGGYKALRKVMDTMSPAAVREEITRSGLRGRGGAGYPAGLKWNTVAKAEGAIKYVICNADEGDPGAFMDRSVLESDPYRVLEGMAIAAYAVGATEGYVYCRAEYPLAVSRLRKAIREASKTGFLGTSILNSKFNFNVEVRLGAGSFVCGEETALVASIQGGRGTPTVRPPYPAVAGLWRRPTLINNVESFANIAPIITKGGAWFASIGTEGSKGTKVFALAGRVVHTGRIEVPMGTTLRDIVFDIGGGIVGGHTFKAVQTGGPSGGCIPAEFLDMPVDYESLIKVGSFMGSGGMIVMDETSCMVDVARYFMDFCREESCGKCVPCRVGTQQLFMLLDKITQGEATMDDLTQMERLGTMVQKTSLCGLGQGAPNPIFSTLRYFRDEYVSHIVDRVCPAGVCKITKVPVNA